MKKLYFCRTNAYNMLISEDTDGNCRYLIETTDFPVIANLDPEEQAQAAKEFLELIEDDSSWEDDCSHDEIFSDGVEIIAEIETDQI